MLKYSVGDIVTVKDTCLHKDLIGSIATIISTNDYLAFPYEVEGIDKSGRSFSGRLTEEDLELTLYKQNPYAPVIIPIVDGGISFAEAGNTHSCSWKTYTGLSYKEEYCECGKTKNKRGIYE